MTDAESSPEASPGGTLRTSIFYGLILVAAVAGFLGIRSLGADLSAPPPPPGAGHAGASPAAREHPLPHVLLALAVITIVARLTGALFKRLRQPRVIGEVLAGICLGPSVLGRLAPDASAFLLPASIAPFLEIVAQVGIVLFMFLVGVELDPARLRHRAHATLAISHASIVVPFLLGASLALWLYPKVSSSDVRFDVFALFLGVSMSVTAFPVLARILFERGLQSTPLGAMALTCAAVNDVTAWCLLAYLVSVVSAQTSGLLQTIGLAVAYLAIVLLLLRPVVRRIVCAHGDRELTQGRMALLISTVLLSAFATESIGIHAVFGAFVLGALVPPHSGVAQQLTAKIEDLVVVLFLPVFFAFTGMRTQIGLVSGAEAWMLCGVIILVASLGKFGGSVIAARVAGVGWREASALGVLMNTRGLMELVVLNVGLDLKVVSPTLFAMLVLMALVTTFATTPALHLLGFGRELAPRPVNASRAARAEVTS